MSNEAAGASSHWEKSKSLLFITLAIWAFFSFVVHWFGSALNGAEGSFPRRLLHGRPGFTNRLRHPDFLVRFAPEQAR